MAITPPTYIPSGSLFGTTTTTTPYTYGNLGLTSSDYSIWGSKGNPYLIAGPTYTPGSGTPINPVPINPAPLPINNGGDDSPVAPWVDPNSAESQAKSYGDLQNWLDRDRTKWRVGSSLLGAPLLDPAIDLMYGINPYTQQSFSWYDGSTDDFGYVGSDNTLEGKDLSAAVAAYDLDFEAGMTDLSQDEYIAQYMAERDASNATAQPVPGWWEGIWGSSQDPLAIQAQQAITTANADAEAEKQAAAQAKLDEIAKYTGMLQGEFDAQMAAQEGLNAEQIELMTQIKGDMQRDFGDFTTQNSQQMALIAAENASMFDSIEEYRAWQLDTNAHQQSWMENQFKDQAATQNDLNSTQTDLMNQIAMDMQGTYGEFSGQMGEQLANMAAENASMFESFAEYKEWMGEEFTTLESGLNEQLAQQAAVNEGLNSNQIDLMNSIAEDMQNQYGDFESGIDGQLEQMAAENASMFDSIEEYQAWNNEQNVTAPVSPVSPPTPPPSPVTPPPSPVTPPPSSGGGDDGYGDSSGGGGGWEGSDAHSDMDEDSGWSGADSDFDDDDSGGGDSDDGGGGSYIATAATQALGEDGLTIFEEWRDYMFDALPTFTTSYGRYRVTAPKIVAKIDTKENSKHIYSWIWDMHLKPIFDMIVEDKDSEKALKDYKIMVKDLQNKFLKEKV